VTCGNTQPFPTLRPIRARKADTSLEKACSAILGDNGPQAVTVTADRCSSQYPQLGSEGIGTARARLSSPPDRTDATRPTSHSVISPYFSPPEPPLRAPTGSLQHGQLLRQICVIWTCECSSGNGTIMSRHADWPMTSYRRVRSSQDTCRR